MLVSAFMLPHGAQIIPGLEDPYPEGFRPLHQAMAQAGKTAAAEKPDLVILLTPHGHSLPEQHTVYLNERFLGLLYNLTESNIFGTVQSGAVWQADRPAAEQVLAAMQAQAIPAVGLIQGAADYPLALAWGETVPLHYVMQECAPRLAILSLPRSRLDRLTAIQDNLAALGNILFDFAASQDRRVSIVISADLAHTHDASGPYGFHESADVLDGLVQQWVQSPTRATLKQMLALQPTGLACGMAGMCVLQVILERSGFQCTGSVYAAPSYFGMIVTHWA